MLCWPTWLQLARMEGSAAGGAVPALRCTDQQRPHLPPLLAPLRQVDYREKLYAVGRIPSTYNKREGTAKEHELLAVRAAGARQPVAGRDGTCGMGGATSRCIGTLQAACSTLNSVLLLAPCLQGRRIGRALRPLFPRGFAQDSVVRHGQRST